MHKQRCDLNSCRANVRVMYELCLLKKEQKEENEELFIYYTRGKAEKEQKSQKHRKGSVGNIRTRALPHGQSYYYTYYF